MPQEQKSDSDFFIHTAGAETAPRSHAVHPPEDELLSLLSGDVANEERSRLHGHLATCSRCHARWKALETHLSDEAFSLGQRSTVPSLASAIRKSHVVGARSPSWWRSLFETRTLVAAGSAAAAMALAFAVLIPVFQSSSQRTSKQIESLSSEIRVLQNQLQWGGPISNGFAMNAIDEDLLLAYDWDDLVQYTTQPGDTWQSIAEAELGSRTLWPLLWVLNRGLGTPGDPVLVGTSASIPRRAE